MKKKTKNKYLIISILVLLLTACGVNVNISKPTVELNVGNVSVSANFPAINQTIYQQSFPSEVLKVYFINVSQGDSELIIFPDNKTMLIDVGKEKYGHVVLELLNKLNITKLDYCLETHHHEDHYGGFKIVGFMCEINQTYTGIYGFNIYPVKNYTNENDNSIITKISYKNVSFLFTGDCASECEEYLVNNINVSVNILKVAHHGSKTSTNTDFLSKVNPEIAVISYGKNTYGHPNNETIKRLINQKVFTTNDNGTILIETDGNKINIGK